MSGPLWLCGQLDAFSCARKAALLGCPWQDNAFSFFNGLGRIHRAFGLRSAAFAHWPFRSSELQEECNTRRLQWRCFDGAARRQGETICSHQGWSRSAGFSWWRDRGHAFDGAGGRGIAQPLARYDGKPSGGRPCGVALVAARSPGSACTTRLCSIAAGVSSSAPSNRRYICGVRDLFEEQAATDQRDCRVARATTSVAGPSGVVG
mmetsp:Transcript_56669/g.106337  ORF Transcript_56669/g.106337 Transcript_56669/m.106337 type:complete len:206 (+) Transcript_56669:260-877(+)